MQLTTCSKPAVQNLLQVCSSQFAASLQFTICSKSAVHNLQQVCSSQFAPSLPFATCSKSAVRNLQQACWQLAADLLSSSRSKRCERILISAWWSQLAASLQQTCCNLRVSGCVYHIYSRVSRDVIISLGVNSKSMHSHREMVFHCMCWPCVWQQICATSWDFFTPVQHNHQYIWVDPHSD